MDVLFLDIDGVLNRFLMNAPPIEPSCIEALTEILRETGCSTVLSSSWRSLIYSGDMSLEGFNVMLGTHGLYGPRLIDTTCAEGELDTRGKEIRRWLAENRAKLGIERYCVLDDDDDGISELHGANFVRTDSRVGLTAENASQAIDILSRKVTA